jgi:ferric-dicitrate binding protein FerR (iron transport regulator)
MRYGDRRDEGPGEKRARIAVGGLSRPAATPEFRARLKEEFLSGAIERTVPIHARPRRRAYTRAWIIALAAAVLLILLLQVNRGPALHVVGAYGSGVVETAGELISVTDEAALEDAIRPGRELELAGDAGVDIVYGRSMLFQIDPGSVFTPPQPPGRWLGRTVRADLEFGEIRIMTGGDFTGTELAIHTPEGITLLTGTIVSVFRDSSVTCVCVYEGSARIGVDELDLEQIPRGKRKVMFRDGSPSMITNLAPPHEAHLREFEARYKDLF